MIDHKKDLSKLSKDEISNYLVEVDNELRARKDRLGTVRTRKLRMQKILLDINASIEKADYLLDSMKMYKKEVERYYWDKKEGI